MNVEVDPEIPHARDSFASRASDRRRTRPSSAELSPDTVAQIEALVPGSAADGSGGAELAPWNRQTGSGVAAPLEVLPRPRIRVKVAGRPVAPPRAIDTPPTTLRVLPPAAIRPWASGGPIEVRYLDDQASPGTTRAVVISDRSPTDGWLEPKVAELRRACDAVVAGAAPNQTIILTAAPHVGSTRELLVAPLEQRGLAAGRDVHVAFFPAPPGGTSVQAPRTTVLGGATPRCADVAASIMGGAGAVQVVETLEEAEATSLAASRQSQLADAVKRATDIVVASVGLIMLFPILLAVAIAIRLDDGGPIIFSQERIGTKGRRFRLYKFRTMQEGAEARLCEFIGLNQIRGPGFQLDSDPRLTRIGRFLRKASLDELAQLWNVLKSDMSLVGPRPAPLVEVAAYESWHRARLVVKPGITGLAQIRARSYRDFDEKARLDLEYILHWSIWLDFRIMLRTVPIVLRLTGR